MAEFKLNTDELAAYGVTLKGKCDTYIKERVGLETQWLKDLRQYRGIYDPDILKLLADDKSHAYPRDTRTKVKAFVAKMMEMMFPASEDNWELVVSPIPSIQKDDLDMIITALEQAELIAAEQEQRPPQPIDGGDIEKAVKQFAEIRKDNMEEKIQDQLADKETDYQQVCKRVIRSGAIFGIGIAKSPMVRTKSEREWEQADDGTWKAVSKKKKRPYPEFVKVWDIYPDLSAWDWDQQEGMFERMVFTRHDFRMLSKRPDMIKANIAKYLRDHQVGNYVKRSFEAGLDQMNADNAGESTVGSSEERKYEVFRWYGHTSAHDLARLGLPIKEEDMDNDILSDIWMIDNTIIKADLAPFGERPSDMYHAFIYSEDEDSGLTGASMPNELRDSQMGLCSSTRAMYDNMAATAGPMLEVAVDLLKRGSDYKSIRSFKVFEREGDDALLAHPAVRAISHPSHIPDITNIISMTRQQFDAESNMPSWTSGNPENLGEAFRTSKNMSMLSSGANLLPKDNVRSFDRFTSSLIGSFLEWNIEFDPDPDTITDMDVRAKGNISLMAKEVRGEALAQEMSIMTEDERAIVKTREALIERWKARDLDMDLIMDADEAEAALGQLRQSRAEAQQLENQKTQTSMGKDQADTQLKGAQAGKAQADTQATLAGIDEAKALIEPRVIEILARVEDMAENAKTKKDQAQMAGLKEMLTLLTAKEEATGGVNVEG